MATSESVSVARKNAPPVASAIPRSVCLVDLDLAHDDALAAGVVDDRDGARPSAPTAMV